MLDSSKTIIPQEDLESINLPNLRILIEAVRATDESHFDMRHVLEPLTKYDDGDWVEFTKEPSLSNFQHCNSSACIGGFCAILNETGIRMIGHLINIDAEREIMEFLNVSRRLANSLAYANECYDEDCALFWPNKKEDEEEPSLYLAQITKEHAITQLTLLLNKAEEVQKC